MSYAESHFATVAVPLSPKIRFFVSSIFSFTWDGRAREGREEDIAVHAGGVVDDGEPLVLENDIRRGDGHGASECSHGTCLFPRPPPWQLWPACTTTTCSRLMTSTWQRRRPRTCRGRARVAPGTAACRSASPPAIVARRAAQLLWWLPRCRLCLVCKIFCFLTTVAFRFYLTNIIQS